jgi:hypothetical protein
MWTLGCIRSDRVDVVFSRWYLHRRGHPGRSILSRCRDTWPEKRSAIVVSCSPNRSARVLRGMESAALVDLFALKIEENRADQAVPLFPLGINRTRMGNEMHALAAKRAYININERE